jgi:ABC-type branched-subunit amino acid transport system permease subunit
MIYGVVIVLIITFSPGGVLSWVRKSSGGVRS